MADNSMMKVDMRLAALFLGIGLLGGVIGYSVAPKGCKPARQAALTYQLGRLGSQGGIEGAITQLRLANDLADKAADC
jgi:hypothetical protein